MAAFEGIKVNLKRLLVLDDDKLVCNSIVSSLTGRVEEIRVCHDVELALDITAKWTPRLLIVDMGLLDGYKLDILKEIQLKNAVMSIIHMSENEEHYHCFVLGLFGLGAFLQKPFGLQELNISIDKAISISLIPKRVGNNPLLHIDFNNINKQINSRIRLAEDVFPDVKLWQIKKK